MTILALLAACSTDVAGPVSRDLRSPSMVTTVASSLLVDTGPGESAPGTGLSGTSPGFTIYQLLAGKFTLVNEANIESVEGWMKVFGLAGDGRMDVHIRSDNAGLPGASIYSKTYTLTATDFAWYPFTAFNVHLAAGMYWLTFEPLPNSGIVASMPRGATSPLAGYAFMAPFTAPNWSTAFSPAASFGIRITGSEVTPVSMIGDLGSFVDGSSMPKGNATSIDSKLQLALDALAANQITSACSYLQDVINYTKAQSGKKITVAVASSIISQTTAIRTRIGC